MPCFAFIALDCSLDETNLICWPMGVTDPILSENKKAVLQNLSLLAFFIFSIYTFNLLFCFSTKLIITKTKKDLSCPKQPSEVFRKKRKRKLVLMCKGSQTRLYADLLRF